jgi:hypothetical protein
MIWGLNTFGQSDSTLFLRKHKWEVGVDVTSVISSFIGNSGTPKLALDFPFTLKRMLKGGNALRFGLGGAFGVGDKVNNQNIFLRNYAQSANLRLGYEYREVLSRRWMVYGGVDAMAQYRRAASSTITNIDNVSLIESGYSLGGGLFLGFQFAINTRLHLGCEGNMYGLFTYKDEHKRFMNFPSTNERIKSTFTQLQGTPPRLLYAIFRF